MAGDDRVDWFGWVIVGRLVWVGDYEARSGWVVAGWTGCEVVGVWLGAGVFCGTAVIKVIHRM